MAIAPLAHFEVVAQGPFDIEVEAGHFGGWPRLGDAVVMPFPVEGWQGSAAVLMRQRGETISGDVHMTGTTDVERAWQQAMATVSLDVDGRGFAEVGRRDPVIGHRISILQTRRIRQRMAELSGATIEVDGTAFRAFPDPHALLRIESFPSVAPAKIERLHQVARAALDGRLDRARLRSLPEEDALAQLRTLPGIGEFFAQGILMRGAGLVDAVTDDDITPRAIQLLYALGERPNRAAILQRAEAWRPYRMWALVLLNVWLRGQPPDVKGRRELRRRPK